MIRTWRRRRRFISAYKTLRDEARRHQERGHHTEFHAFNEANISLRCYDCPDFRPRPKPTLPDPGRER